MKVRREPCHVTTTTTTTSLTSIAQIGVANWFWMVGRWENRGKVEEWKIIRSRDLIRYFILRLKYYHMIMLLTMGTAGMTVVLFWPGLAWKPQLWPGLRLLWLPQTSGQAKAATHGLAPAWLGPGHGFCMSKWIFAYSTPALDNLRTIHIINICVVVLVYHIEHNTNKGDGRIK
jgi:hypothetical protein